MLDSLLPFISQKITVFANIQICFQGSISLTFYEQLLCVQIPKEQNKYSHIVFFTLSGSVQVKAARETLMKNTPDESMAVVFFLTYIRLYQNAESIGFNLI